MGKTMPYWTCVYRPDQAFRRWCVRLLRSLPNGAIALTVTLAEGVSLDMKSAKSGWLKLMVRLELHKDEVRPDWGGLDKASKCFADSYSSLSSLERSGSWFETTSSAIDQATSGSDGASGIIGAALVTLDGFVSLLDKIAAVSLIPVDESLPKLTARCRLSRCYKSAGHCCPTYTR